MLKNVVIYSGFVLSLASCTSLKTAFTGKKENVNPAVASAEKKESIFLDKISMPVEKSSTRLEPVSPGNTTKPETFITKTKIYEPALSVEKVSPLQIKYSVLMNTPVEEVTNTRMFEFIDDWYGTKYRLGGTTKKGIDCSAFSQYLFAAVFGISLPRTAREQYKMTNRISRTELKEGDLIFFNTRGGVSHVGVYLQNNKFVHASTSEGVAISDIFDSYWVRRFIGVGRLKNETIVASAQ
jgi:lipoprotein Spr